MIRMMASVIAAAILIAVVADAGAGESADPKSTTPPTQSRYKAPEYEARPVVTWPGDQDREAIVYVRVSISADGKVTSTEVDEGGFYELRFAEEAVAAAKRTKFRPARFDDVAIATTVVIPFSFYWTGATEGGRIRDPHGISDEVRGEVLKIQDLFKKGDLAGANDRAERAVRQKVKFRYEYFVLRALMADTNLRVGRDREALQAAKDATRSTAPNFGKLELHQPIPPNNAANYTLPPEVVIPLLDSRMRIAAKLGLNLEALQAWYELAGLTAVKPGDPRAAIASQITAKLEGKESLTARMLMKGNRMSWDLFRHGFTLTEVEGAIESMNLYCGNEFQKLDYAPGKEWTVPAGWVDCSVELTGKRGTSFNIVELAD